MKQGAKSPPPIGRGLGGGRSNILAAHPTAPHHLRHHGLHEPPARQCLSSVPVKCATTPPKRSRCFGSTAQKPDPRRKFRRQNPWALHRRFPLFRSHAGHRDLAAPYRVDRLRCRALLVLGSQGLKVIRFWNHECSPNRMGCAKHRNRIDESMRLPTPLPPPVGRPNHRRTAIRRRSTSALYVFVFVKQGT